MKFHQNFTKRSDNTQSFTQGMQKNKLLRKGAASLGEF